MKRIKPEWMTEAETCRAYNDAARKLRDAKSKLACAKEIKASERILQVCRRRIVELMGEIKAIINNGTVFAAETRIHLSVESTDGCITDLENERTD